MIFYTAYELEDDICENLSTNTTFLQFCTSLIGEECKVIGGEDPQNPEPEEDYPCVVVNIDRQTGDQAKDKSTDRSIEISILLEASSERVQVGNYYKYADTPKAEKIAIEIYNLIVKKYCGDVPPYYFERDVSLINQGILRGSLELIASQETTLGGRVW